MSQISIVEGPDLGRSHVLGEVTRIGTGIENELVLSDRRSGACRVVIRHTDRGFLIEGVRGSNRLTVNDRPVHRAVLRHGDVFRVGMTKILFSDESAAPSGRGVRMDLEEGDTGSPLSSQILQRQEHYPDARSVIVPLELRGRSGERLATLFRIASVACEGNDLDSLLDSIMEIVFEDLVVDRVVIVLARGNGSAQGGEYAWERDRGRVRGKARFSRTIIDHVLETSESILTANAMDDSRFQSGHSIVEHSIVNAICVPLISREEALGVLHVDRDGAGRPFEQDDLDQLSKIGVQVAIAIENAMTHEEPKIFSDHLRRLGRAMQWLSSYLQRDLILKEGVALAQSLFDFSRCSILLLDSKRGQLRLAYAKGIPREVDLRRIAVPMGEGVAGLAASEGRMLLSPDPDTGSPPDGVVPTERPGYRGDSFLVLPIFGGTDEIDKPRRLIGVLNVTDKVDLSPITRIEQELLTILSNQIGIALTNAELYSNATVDPLTRLYVRRYFFLRLSDEIRRAQERDLSLSLMMMDLDHFKRANDNYGHQAGDAILRQLGRRIQGCVGPKDVAARYGGEEFAWIVLGGEASDLEEKAERLRKAVADTPFQVDEREIPMTLSIGVTTMEGSDDRESLIQRADVALYQAKDRGRNRVVVHE